MKIVNYLVLFVSVFILSACVGTQEAPKPTLGANSSVKNNQKVFEEEDRYILFALRAEQIGEYDASSSIFNTLYEKSNKKEYFYRSLQNDLSAKKNQKIIDRVDAYENPLEDPFLMRIKIVALVEVGKLPEAELLSLRLAKKTKTADDYILVAKIQLKEGKTQEAIEYLEDVYSDDYNEKIIDEISVITFVNLGKPKEAIAKLETHASVHGHSKLITLRLIRYYSTLNDIDGLLESYLKLYQIDKSEQVSQKIIQIYTYKKEKLQLINFLENSRSDDRTLLQLYVSEQNYAKAYKLADELYAKSGEIHYLGQSAIYEYESNIKKDEKVTLKSVISKFKEVVAVNDDTLYLNYYGYLLIDHKIDVKKGMKYVEEALKVSPKSAYYLDSLAWGYYRLGECKKAREIIEKVLTLEGGDDKEVLLHQKAIKKCKTRRKGKK
jgi:predicted Zn-dependent protease